jgi:hypothetical protein
VAPGKGDPETRLLRPKPESPGQALAICQASLGIGFPEGEIARHYSLIHEEVKRIVKWSKDSYP